MIDEVPVQSVTAGSGSASSLTPTLGTAATAGNLLVYNCTVRGAVTFSTPPSGFTEVAKIEVSTALSCWFGVKKAAGGETGVLIGFNAGGKTGHAGITEYSGTDLDLDTLIDVFNSDTSNINTATTSQGTGSATSTVADSLAIAAFGFDIGNTMDGGRSLTSGYTERTNMDFTSGSRGCFMHATRVLSATGSQSCTFTTTDTGDEAWGSIVIVPGTVAGGGSILPMIQHYNHFSGGTL